MKKAKPCPKCGAFGATAKETVVRDSQGTFSYFIVRCPAGHTAATYGENTTAQAINLWNTWNGYRRFSIRKKG